MIQSFRLQAFEVGGSDFDAHLVQFLFGEHLASVRCILYSVFCIPGEGAGQAVYYFLSVRAAWVVGALDGTVFRILEGWLYRGVGYGSVIMITLLHYVRRFILFNFGFM